MGGTFRDLTATPLHWGHSIQHVEPQRTGSNAIQSMADRGERTEERRKEQRGGRKEGKEMQERKFVLRSGVKTVRYPPTNQKSPK